MNHNDEHRHEDEAVADLEDRLVDNPRNLPLLHDLEHYIQSRGILDGNAAPSLDSTLGVDREALVRENENYKRSVFRNVFQNANDEDEKLRKERKNFLESLRGETTTILVTTDDDGTKITAPLDLLASLCDTVYTMMRAKPLFALRDDVEDSKVSCLEENTLDLTEFSRSSVEEFLLLLLSSAKSESELDLDFDEGDDDDGEERKDSSGTADDPPSVSVLTDINAVELCRLSHYLQCHLVSDLTVRALREAVDDDNCASLAALADELGLPSLFEATLPFLLRKSLAEMEDDGFWNGASDPLRRRVVALRDASRSSVLNAGRNVFFASADEFLALVSDDLRERKERLWEARQRQQQLEESREQQGSLRDAAIKIERQERRIRTLTEFYEQQKRLLRFQGRENEPYRA